MQQIVFKREIIFDEIKTKNVQNSEEKIQTIESYY